MTSASAMNIELVTEADLPDILALSNWAVENTPANFATSPESLSEWTASWRETRERYPWLVARYGERLGERRRGSIAGFAKASPHRVRGAYGWTAEVTVYIHHEMHRRGIGRALYRLLIPTVRAQGYVTLLAGITPPNPGSEGLHAATGFVHCGTYHRTGWKFSRWHDVGYWERHLQRADLPPGEIRPVTDVWPQIRRWASGGLEIRPTALGAPVSQSLIAELNRELAALYPEPGANHFRLEESEVAGERGAFVVAYLESEPVGCGAIRLGDDAAAEVKRMFVAPRWRGIGISRPLLAALEERATQIGAKRVVLETGVRQSEALALYANCGYERIAPFGEYVDSPLSICMGKLLLPAS
ncbi:MAG TPA: GNAT family N-acetyltransferase [Polyangiaceae bacterium]|nr:GNAT family N-acetyltransferase [Polyangiaceae bacterium]